MKFSEIIGHEDIKRRLRDMADTGKIPHALLFGGQPGIGKLQMARAMAQYVQCADRHDGDSCGRCPSCMQHAQMANPDTHFVYPIVKKPSLQKPISSDYYEEWKRFLIEEPYARREKWLEMIDAGNSQPVIYVQEASEISRTALMSNYASAFKIYIIWLPEAMNTETANKLLKLIEEPWPNTLFFLVSNEPGLLLPTIFSRTQRINFKPLKPDEISLWLRRSRDLSDSAADIISARAEGSALKAVELAEASGESEEFGNMYRSMMRGAYSRKLKDLYELGDHLAGEGREKMVRYLQYCSRMCRENFIYNLRMPTLVSLNPKEEEFSNRFSPYINYKNVEVLIAETDKARRDISRNANPRVVLFDYMLQIARYIKI